jgi:hypothetical protein
MTRTNTRIVLSPNRVFFNTRRNCSSHSDDPLNKQHERLQDRNSNILHNSSSNDEVKPWMVTFTAPKSSVSVRFGKILSKTTSLGIKPSDLPLSWRRENKKLLLDFQRASAAIQRSRTYKLGKANQGINPVGLKGWASLVRLRYPSSKNFKGLNIIFDRWKNV